MRKAARVATAAVMSTTTAPILMTILFFCSRDLRAAARAGGSALGSGSNPPLPFPETNASLQWNIGKLRNVLKFLEIQQKSNELLVSRIQSYAHLKQSCHHCILKRFASADNISSADKFLNIESFGQTTRTPDICHFLSPAYFVILNFLTKGE